MTKPQQVNIGERIKLNEKSRVYCFPNGNIIKIKDVIELVVRPSGTHRIRTADKKLFIVSPGWLCIKIDGEDWTV